VGCFGTVNATPKRFIGQEKTLFFYTFDSYSPMGFPELHQIGRPVGISVPPPPHIWLVMQNANRWQR